MLCQSHSFDQVNIGTRNLGIGKNLEKYVIKKKYWHSEKLKCIKTKKKKKVFSYITFPLQTRLELKLMYIVLASQYEKF